MKGWTWILVLLMLGTTAGFAQQQHQDQLAITLSVANPVVTLGAPIDITVVARNIISQPVDWSTLCSAMLDYKFAVLGPDGKPLKPTPLYDRMLNGPGIVVECAISATLAPGEESKMGANLAQFFEIRAPGKYVVQATRHSVTSNKLEITITR